MYCDERRNKDGGYKAELRRVETPICRDAQESYEETLQVMNRTTLAELLTISLGTKPHPGRGRALKRAVYYGASGQEGSRGLAVNAL